MVVLCDRYAIQGARERSESESKPSSPWNTDFAAMAKKTAVRRLCKLLPLDDQLRQYVQAEEHDERDTTPLGAIDVEASEPEAIGTVRRSRIFDARDNGPPDDPPPPEGEFDDYDPTSEGAP
jgi:recombination protein RecT